MLGKAEQQFVDGRQHQASSRSFSLPRVALYDRVDFCATSGYAQLDLLRKWEVSPCVVCLSPNVFDEKSRKKRVSLRPLSDELTDLSQEHDDSMVSMIMLEAWSSVSEGLEGVRRETALPRTL